MGPKWDLTFKGENAKKMEVNPFDWTQNPGKRGAIESPEGRISKRNKIDDWQICEFLWAFLEGTTTAQKYKNLTWENQPEEVTEESEEKDDEAEEKGDEDAENEEEDPEESLEDTAS